MRARLAEVSPEAWEAIPDWSLYLNQQHASLAMEADLQSIHYGIRSCHYSSGLILSPTRYMFNLLEILDLFLYYL